MDIIPQWEGPLLAGTMQSKVVEESASKVEQASCLFIENEGKCTEEFMVRNIRAVKQRKTSAVASVRDQP